MIDKTFSPPSEEVRTKLLARSGQCERLVDFGKKASGSGTAQVGLQLGGVATIGSVGLDRTARGLIWPLLLSRTNFTSHDGR
jgi:hypothetical protein